MHVLTYMYQVENAEMAKQVFQQITKTQYPQFQSRVMHSSDYQYTNAQASTYILAVLSLCMMLETSCKYMLSNWCLSHITREFPSLKMDWNNILSTYDKWSIFMKKYVEHTEVVQEQIQDDEEDVFEDFD